MKERIEKKRLAILRVLRDADGPMASKTITDELLDMGYDISPRTIRFHLKWTDDEGFTEYSEKHGRYITEKGLQELEASRVYDKVGFLNARIEQMAWRMDFDIRSQKGSVIINISFIKKTDLDSISELLIPMFKTGFTMGQLVRLYSEGEQIGNRIVPEGWIGLGTVCSFTFNGILTKAGIPIHSRFGGLLQIEKNEPTRFLEIINYDGTSIDPLEIFIQSRMTDFTDMNNSGSGRVGANFFEIPAEARRQTVRIIGRMEKLGLGNILKLGYPEHALLEIPINVGRVGGIAIGGLNPIAALIENDIEVISHAVSDITDFSSLFHFSSLPARIKTLR
jgi:repressor of nif and glnA expression